MTGIETIGRVFEEIERRAKSCRDELVPVSAIAFDNLSTVRVGLERHPLKVTAARQISNRLGVPYPYLERCTSDVQAYNLNHWVKRERNDELFFRFDGEAVRAIFTPRYVPVDHDQVLQELLKGGLSPDTPVQVALDDHLLMLNLPETHKAFHVNGRDRMLPGISITNSEVGISSLTVAAFILRLVCTNGMITRQKVETRSYRHVSEKVILNLPEAFQTVSLDIDKHRDLFQLSLDSPVKDPQATLASFNRQFQLSTPEQESVEWAWPFEAGGTMFHIVNAYTKAAQNRDLPAESARKLQQVGGQVLSLVRPGESIIREEFADAA